MTKENIQKAENRLDAVETFRKIKDETSVDLYGKSNKQIKEYLRQHSQMLKSK